MPAVVAVAQEQQALIKTVALDCSRRLLELQPIMQVAAQPVTELLDCLLALADWVAVVMV
jgi:hypothetical protein